MASVVKAKKSCCKSSPRCKRCPVVLDRLAGKGHANRVSKRRYVVEKVPGKAMRKARKR